MGGGKCWCHRGGEKSFDISIEEASSKLRSVTVEKGSGCSGWIRFWEFSLRNLIDGVEACFREERVVCNKVWGENQRDFKLEGCANGIGRLMHCSVCDGEVKRLSLVLPKRRGSCRRWHA